MYVLIFLSSIGDIGNLAGDKPDPDTIKMFVGQVPHDMEENDLRTMFEEFGRVHQINVLRNKYTGTHQGNYYYFLEFVIGVEFFTF